MKLSKTAKTLLIGANIWYFGEGMLGQLFAISVKPLCLHSKKISSQKIATKNDRNRTTYFKTFNLRPTVKI